MDTALLETFRQVARHGSISGAARRLAYTQSAVSRQVAALEVGFGVRLFDRRAGGVQLTEHGRCLQPHAESLLERLDHARRDLEALDRLEGGRLRIGAFDTANASLIPRAMATFATKWPSVSLSLVEGITRRQLARLESDDTDLAVVSAFPGQSLDHKRFDLVPLLEEQCSSLFHDRIASLVAADASASPTSGTRGGSGPSRATTTASSAQLG
jgi:DNA-binding transcriptional LysR family regulator